MKLDEWLRRLLAVPPGQSPLAYGLAIDETAICSMEAKPQRQARAFDG